MYKNPKERIHALSHAYLLSSAIHAAAELGIADLLSEKSEQTADELAQKLKVDGRSLFRLLRYLASHQIFSHHSNDLFSLNPEAAYLADKHPESIRHALLVTPGPRWNAMGAIKEAVITGKPAFDVLYGKTYYEHLAQDTESAQRFNAHMTAYTREEDSLISTLLPLENTKTLADIGGGEGQFLNEILKNFPKIYGILFDLNVISNKEPLKVSGDNNRWEAQDGNFFESVPPGIDSYVLKRVLHNWSDEDCIKIMTNICRAMHRKSSLLIIEGVIPESAIQHPSKDTDLFLMTLFTGCGRTEKEFTELGKQAGLEVTRILPTSTFLSIIELNPIH